MRALNEGLIVGLANHTLLIAKDGAQRPIDDSAAPMRDANGKTVGAVLVFRDITERKRAGEALAERMHSLALNAEIGIALAESGSLPETLQRCAEAMVQHLGGAFARIWTFSAKENVLVLQASAGQYTHLDGPHSRIALGQFKIGRIAQERKPHLTNDVVNDPAVSDPQWAKREGMVAFAGYPLIVEHRLVGVMAMFARHALSDTTLQAMESISNGIGLGIEHKQAEAALRQTERRFKAVFNQQFQFMAILAPDGTVLEANDTCFRTTGASLAASPWPTALGDSLVGTSSGDAGAMEAANRPGGGWRRSGDQRNGILAGGRDNPPRYDCRHGLKGRIRPGNKHHCRRAG